MNVALIGFGYWGPNIARNIMASEKLHLYAICDTIPARLERARKLYGAVPVKFVSGYEALLECPDIGGIVIATPTKANYQLAMGAIKYGKHIFIEKPMTATSAQAYEVAAAAEKAGVIIHVDHIMLYNKVILYIKNMIDSGELGELIYYDSSRMNLGPIRKDVNAMLDLAVHDLAVIDYLSGGGAPLFVDAVGGSGYGKQETLTYLTMKYEGFIAHLRSSWISPIKERRMIIGGTKKMVLFDDVKSIDKLTVYDSGIEVNASDIYGDYEYKVRTGDIQIPYIEQEDSLFNSLDHFALCVEKNMPSRSSPLQAIRVIETLERAQICLEANGGLLSFSQ
ncbi:MAG: Gfo/Idh/MocA family oxidoreductase [Clostridiales bacterium]|jgi:predicted dehydrogenase|nr:Gfo/Idh/MocA family oxidoreductase [Clostridiales bacterium]